MLKAGCGQGREQTCAGLGPLWVLLQGLLSSEAGQCSASGPDLLDLGEALRRPQSLFSQTSGRQSFLRADPGSRGWLVEIIHGQEKPEFCILASPHLNITFTLCQR